MIGATDGSAVELPPPGNDIGHVVVGNVKIGGQSLGQYSVDVDAPSESFLNQFTQMYSRKPYYIRQRPQYETFTLDDIINVKDHGAKGDGVGDDTAAIKSVMGMASTSKLIYFPAGSYIVTGTIHVPSHALITGEAWSQIVASGSFFQDMKNPKPMVKVGNDGDQGTVEISDMLFTSTGSLPGLVLMEWNVAAEEQGSVAMFDAHFRVGGAYGSKLTLADCPKVTSMPSACVAASMLFHVTPKANGYFENVWGRVADHDPDFSETCNGSKLQCDFSWAAMFSQVSNVTIAGAGLYSWFDAYDQSVCVDAQNCQQRLIFDQGGNGELWVFNLVSIGSVEMIIDDSSAIEAAKENTQANAHPFWSALAVWGDGQDEEAAGQEAQNSSSSSKLQKRCGRTGARFYGIPKGKDSYAVPNPKDAINKVMPQMLDLQIQLAARQAQMAIGDFNDSASDVGQALSLPVFMMAESIEQIKEAKEAGQKIKNQKDLEFFEKMLGVIFMFLPFLDTLSPELLLFEGMATGLGNTALAIQDIVEHPKNAFMDVLGIVMDGTFSKTGKGYKTAADARRGMSSDLIKTSGKTIEQLDGKLQDVLGKACTK
ncbi:LysM domain-containing protein, partial [Metarhizium majus ARSEF 297]